MSQEDSEIGVTVKEQMVEWTIKNLEYKITRNAGAIIRTFYFDKTELCFTIYCSNWLSPCDELLSLKLFTETDFPRSINCTMGIKKCDGSVLRSFSATFRSSLFPFGHPYFELKKFMRMSEVSGDAMSASGSVTFFCTLSTAGGQNSREEKDAACQTSYSVGNAEQAAAEGTASSECVKSMAQHLKELYISGTYSDVVIKVEDREFQVHRGVLSVRSSVFAAMFQHDMAEKLSGVVDIVDCDARCFEAFLLFLYTADEIHVTLENAVGLFTIAEKFQIIDLKKASVQFLKGHLQIDTICDAVQLAVVHAETELLEAATEFFISNSSAILETPQWKEFIVENPLMASDLFIKKLDWHGL